MEWITLKHLNPVPKALGVGGGVAAQCAVFHPVQALIAVAAGRIIAEFDIVTGCKLSSIDIGSNVVKMAYSPYGGHVIIAVLEDWTIRGWDLDTEHTSLLYSPLDKKSDKGGASQVEVHIAMTPMKPWLFFGAHRRTSVNVVGTVEGARPAQKIKTDVKKPITNLACHPRGPYLYIAYGDGSLRGYNMQTWTVVYQLIVEPPSKLVGAGAIAFHDSHDLIFVGDRGGMLLGWDVSQPTRPLLAGSVQVSSVAVSSVIWNSTLQMLLTLSRDGEVRTWRVRVDELAALQQQQQQALLPSSTAAAATAAAAAGASSPGQPAPPPPAPRPISSLFESAGVEPLDVADVLLQEGGEAVYPVPRAVDLVAHPRLNAATVLFATTGPRAGEEANRRANNMTREGRRQLLAVLQGARGGSGMALKERLGALGLGGILSEYQLQQQQYMQQSRGSSKIAQPTLADHARKAFLYGNPKEAHASGGPVHTIPLLTVADPSNPLKDIPVVQPFSTDLGFFSDEKGVFTYPMKVDFMDGCNLMGYSVATGDYSTYRRLSATGSGGGERTPKHLVYSSRQQAWLVCFEVRGGAGECAIVRSFEAATLTPGERIVTMTGRDGAFTGIGENQFAILEQDGLGLIVHEVAGVPTTRPQSPGERSAAEGEDGALDPSDFADPGVYRRGGSRREGAIQFVFEDPVQRVFGAPQDYALLYVLVGSHMGMASLIGSIQSSMNGMDPSGAFLLSTRPVEDRCLRLQPLETVLQVRWQETGPGPVAAVLTTQRVLLVSSDLQPIASTSASVDCAYPPFRTITWVGPALLFSTATAVCQLGWDGAVRQVATLDWPHASIVGCLNDRLLLAIPSERGGWGGGQRGLSVEIRARMVGLLEPLLIGWTTLSKCWDTAVDLRETFIRLTTRFDSIRVTPRATDVLCTSNQICTDLAVELAQAGPQFTQEMRCNYAIRSRQFPTALQILKDEFVRTKDYPRCPPQSRLFHRIRELGRACIKWGQFDRAKEVFELSCDWESMFDLFLCHQNPSAMRVLVQKIEENKGSAELKRLAEHLLAVRSTSWGAATQGLQALVGESMGPKPPEWGGGMWEVLEQIQPPPVLLPPITATPPPKTKKAEAEAEGEGAGSGDESDEEGGEKPEGEASPAKPTPTNQPLKAGPQAIVIQPPPKKVEPVEWELTTEVAAYMKTVSAPGSTATHGIPLIAPDSLGVVLGTERVHATMPSDAHYSGRFSPRLGGGANGEGAAAGGWENGAAAGASSLEGLASLVGGLTLRRPGSRTSMDWDDAPEQFGAVNAPPTSGTARSSPHEEADEQSLQARAAEEFKRGMYGDGFSSSDEEDGAASAKRKIRIKIKDKKEGGPQASVDLSKVREATKALKLGELGKPPIRRPGHVSRGSSGGGSPPRESFSPLSGGSLEGLQGAPPLPSGGRNEIPADFYLQPLAPQPIRPQPLPPLQQPLPQHPPSAPAAGAAFPPNPSGFVPPAGMLGTPMRAPGSHDGKLASFGSLQDFSSHPGGPPPYPGIPPRPGQPFPPPHPQQHLYPNPNQQFQGPALPPPPAPGAYPQYPPQYPPQQPGGMYANPNQPPPAYGALPPGGMYPPGMDPSQQQQQGYLPQPPPQGPYGMPMQMGGAPGAPGLPPGAGGFPPPQGGFELGFPGGGVPPQSGPGSFGGFGGPGSVGSAGSGGFGMGVPPQGGVGVSPPVSVDLGSFTPDNGNGPGSVSGEALAAALSTGSLPGGGSAKLPPTPSDMPTGKIVPGQVPRGASASTCFKVGVVHVEQNELADALACLDECFGALAKDQSLGKDIQAQARVASQYKIAVLLLQEIVRLQKVEAQAGAKEEMARLSRHLASLPLQAKHRISCIRTAVKRNMDVQNYAVAKRLLDLLLSKAPPTKQGELKALISVCTQRGLTDRTADANEDPSKFDAASFARLPTIGHDTCDTCNANFSAVTSAACVLCGLGKVVRSDGSNVTTTPFG